jgi:hypothetical protein
MGDLVRTGAYQQWIADEICERLIGGESLRSICEDEHMPGKSTVLRWAHDDTGGFRDQYAHARELSSESDADDVGHISRMAAAGKIDPRAATAAIMGLKWTAGQRNAKKYGPRAYMVPPEGDQTIVIVNAPEGE